MHPREGQVRRHRRCCLVTLDFRLLRWTVKVGARRHCTYPHLRGRLSVWSRFQKVWKYARAREVCECPGWKSACCDHFPCVDRLLWISPYVRICLLPSVVAPLAGIEISPCPYGTDPSVRRLHAGTERKSLLQNACMGYNNEARDPHTAD